MGHASPAIAAHTSANFSLAKVLAIFMVVTGHWFTGTILWIPVTFGLFVFAYSSAFFTASIYGTRVDSGRFWKKKFQRLGLRFLMTSAFISLLLLFSDKPVFHWHTLLHFVGLSGLLNWLQLPNQSGLGAGLWFFTLLLGFYLVYPYIAKAKHHPRLSLALALVAVFVAVYLEEQVKVGHELWLTMLGFWLGSLAGLHAIQIRARYPLMNLVLGCVLLIVFNLVAGTNRFNTALICFTSINAGLWLTFARLPPAFFRAGIHKLEQCLLEIYLIHTYLFIHPTGVNGLDYLISGFIIVITAMGLNKVITWVDHWLTKSKVPS